MNIEEIRKEMIREEFMKKLGNDLVFETDDIIVECPRDMRLKDFGTLNDDRHACCLSNCKKCWLNAIKDIKFKGEDEMEKEKTFKEVIDCIKEGEIWEQQVYGLTLRQIKMTDSGNIYFKLSQERNSFVEGGTFKLKRKEYNFEEAWKEYKKGKEIESKVTRNKHKIIDDKDKVKYKNAESYMFFEDSVIVIREIDGMWYIND